MTAKRKIKVAQVITRLDWGGSPDIVRIICRYLDTGLYEVKLITGPTRYPSEKTKEFLNDFKGRITVIPQLKRNISPLDDLLALIKLYLLFIRERFDIVHAHTAKAGILARAAALLSGRPVIIHTPHGHNFYGYFGEFLSRMVVIIERIAACFTDKIIVMTELEREDFMRFKVAGSAKLSLIYQGLELYKYAQPGIDRARARALLHIAEDENLVGMVGRLEAIKGPEFFVEAAGYVKRKFNKTKFVLVGDGSLRKRLEEQAQELGLDGSIIFTGWREDIPEIISALDILVLPSLNEGVGMVLIEAQASGVPVVATRVGGIPEIVLDNKTGILVSAGNPGHLAEGINYLLCDKERRMGMSEAAKEWIAGRFRAEDMVNEISQLYNELIGSAH